MTVEFAYRIGDVVTHKGFMMPHPARGIEPQRLVIMGRIADEVSTGIQRLYRVRPVNIEFEHGGFTRDLFNLLEEELVPYPEGKKA